MNWTSAAKTAENVTIEELVELLHASPSIAIYRRRAHKRLAHVYVGSVHLSNVANADGTTSPQACFLYNYQTSHGQGKTGVISLDPSTRRADVDPIFEFYNIGRVVRVASVKLAAVRTGKPRRGGGHVGTPAAGTPST